MSRRRKISNVPHDVYRVYDVEMNLLYVGCSLNAFKRIKQHKHEYQPWFPLAATVDVTQYPDFKTARYIEAVAIAYESPMWNKAKEARAITRGSELKPEPREEFSQIPIADFWRSA